MKILIFITGNNTTAAKRMLKIILVASNCNTMDNAKNCKTYL